MSTETTTATTTTAALVEQMPALNLSSGTAPVPTTIDGYKQLTESLKQEVKMLKKEMSEVRSSMLMRMIRAKAKRKQLGLKSGVRLQSLVQKARDDDKVSQKMNEHEVSQKKRNADIVARREAAHERLMRRRENVNSTPGKKKKDKTSIHPEVIHQRVGTDAVDVDDYLIHFSHGPLGLHLEEIHDCNYSSFVAETQDNSQARQLGIQTGDILIKIKNMSMEDIPFDDTIQTLMASGRPLSLTFRRRLKVYCDHAEGLDGVGHMNGTVYSFDAGTGDLGFSLEEMSNSTLNGVRYDLCVTDVKMQGPAAAKGLKAADVLVGINGDSVGGLGFEETQNLLIKSPRPMSLHFFRFSTRGESDTIEMGTDYLHEEVVFVLQYVDLATARVYITTDLASMSRKDEVKVKNLQEARHELTNVKGTLVSLLDEGALHSDRDSCANLLQQIRLTIAKVDAAQSVVDSIEKKKQAKLARKATKRGSR